MGEKKPRCLMGVMLCYLMQSLLLYSNQQSTLTDFEQSLNQQDKIQQIHLNESSPRHKKTINYYKNPHPKKPSLQNTPFPSPFPKIVVHTITLNGISLLKPFETYYLTLPYLNKPITNHLLFQLIQDIQTYYVKRGWITTRVSIPKQNLAKGILILDVIEGTLGHLYTNHLSWYNKLKLWQLFPISDGTYLNDFALRLAIDHAQRLHSIKIETELRPGATLGETNILVKINDVKNPWLTYIVYDSNSRNLVPSFFQITRDNLFGHFDQWKLSFSHRIRNYYNSRSIILGMSFPLKSLLFSFGYVESLTNQYIPQLGIENNMIHSTNKKWQASTTWTMFYNSVFIGKLISSLSIKRNKATLGNAIINSQTPNQTLVGISLDSTLSWHGQTSTSLSFEKTVPWLNGQIDQSTDIDSEHYEFEKWSGSFRYVNSIPIIFIGKIASSIAIIAQKLSTVTPLSEHNSIGGWHSIRGFQQMPQFGENSIEIKMDNMLPFSQYQSLSELNHLNISLKSFIDIGLAHRPYGLPISDQNNASKGYSIGVGVGFGMSLFSGDFNWSIAKGLKSSVPIPSMEIFWSWRASF